MTAAFSMFDKNFVKQLSAEKTVNGRRRRDIHVQYDYHAPTVDLTSSFHNRYARYVVDIVRKPNVQTVNLLSLYSFGYQFFYKFMSFQLLVAIRFRVIREKRKIAFLILKIRNHVSLSVLLAGADQSLPWLLHHSLKLFHKLLDRASTKQAFVQLLLPVRDRFLDLLLRILLFHVFP